MEELGVEVVEDPDAPLECPCGCGRAGHRKGLRITDGHYRVDARAISERARARLRAQTCEKHPTYRLTRTRGLVVCRACQHEEREAVSPAREAV